MPPQNNFDFIVNPQSQKKMGPSFLQNPKQRMLAIIVFIVSILIIVVVAFSALTGSGSQNSATLTSVAAYQTELIRISDLALKDVTDPNTKGDLIILSSALKSDLSNTTLYLKSKGTKLKPETLNSKLDSTVNTKITNAKQSNTINSEIYTIIDLKLNEYASVLSSTLDAAKSPELKEILNKAVANIITYDTN